MIPHNEVDACLKRYTKPNEQADMVSVWAHFRTNFDPAWALSHKDQIISLSLESYARTCGFRPNGSPQQMDFYSIVKLNDEKKGAMEWAFLGHVFKNKRMIKKRIKLIEKKRDQCVAAVDEEIQFWQAYL